MSQRMEDETLQEYVNRKYVRNVRKVMNERLDAKEASEEE